MISTKISKTFLKSIKISKLKMLSCICTCRATAVLCRHYTRCKCTRQSWRRPCRTRHCVVASHGTSEGRWASSHQPCLPHSRLRSPSV